MNVDKYLDQAEAYQSTEPSERAKAILREMQESREAQSQSEG